MVLVWKCSLLGLWFHAKAGLVCDKTRVKIVGEFGGFVARKWVLGLWHRKEFKDATKKPGSSRFIKRIVHSQDGQSRQAQRKEFITL